MEDQDQKKKKISKYTYTQVQDIFSSSGCELLSETYTKNKDILRFKCKCETICDMTFKKFLVQKCCEECHKTTLTRRFKYTFDEVKAQFALNNCILISTEYKNQITNLDYKCECGGDAKITFKMFLEGQRCKDCAIRKRKETNLKVYGNEVSMNCPELKEKWIEKIANRTEVEKEEIRNKRKRTNMEIYGVEHSLQSQDVKDKGKVTNLERYGFEFTLQAPEIRARIVATNLEKYGCVTPLQNPDIIKIIQEKLKVTNLQRYGFACALQNEEIFAKVKATNLERYGFECALQNEEIKEKIKATNIGRYGFECALQNEEIFAKVKATNLERYGVEYVAQNAEIHEKIMKYSTKKYMFPSGKEVSVQGYENIAIDILLETYQEDLIETSRKEMPEIWYNYKMTTKRYFPDIYIPSENKIIEVKSLWTYKRELVKNICKALATRELGYDYEIWIIDKKKIVHVL